MCGERLRHKKKEYVIWIAVLRGAGALMMERISGEGLVEGSWVYPHHSYLQITANSPAYLLRMANNYPVHNQGIVSLLLDYEYSLKIENLAATSLPTRLAQVLFTSALILFERIKI